MRLLRTLLAEKFLLAGSALLAVANLIGAQLYLQSGAPAGRFWKLFAAVSSLLLALLLGFALGWTRWVG